MATRISTSPSSTRRARCRSSGSGMTMGRALLPLPVTGWRPVRRVRGSHATNRLPSIVSQVAQPAHFLVMYIWRADTPYFPSTRESRGAMRGRRKYRRGSRGHARRGDKYSVISCLSCLLQAEVGAGGGGDAGGDGCQRQAVLGGEGAEVVVGGGERDDGAGDQLELDAHGAERRLDGFLTPLRLQSLAVAQTHAEGGAFAQNEGGEPAGVLGAGEDGEQDAGAVLLHLEWGVTGVERARREQAIQQPAERLAGHVVYVAFEDGDLIALEAGGVVREGCR